MQPAMPAVKCYLHKLKKEADELQYRRHCVLSTGPMPYFATRY